MPNSRKKKGGGGGAREEVDEDVRIALTLAIKKFKNNDEEKEYEFPSSLTSTERAFVHRLVSQYSLKSKSYGQGAKRALTVYKEAKSSIVQDDAGLTLTAHSVQAAHLLLINSPLSEKEKHLLTLPEERAEKFSSKEDGEVNRTIGKLYSGVPQVPPPATNVNEETGSSAHRKALPIWDKRQAILDAIENNQVVIIKGETGSGKTTQVPQFILEHAEERGSAVRIVCTEPRRIAAVAMADRVSHERGEKAGQTVGFQIRLESRVSPKTLLTFCTNGVLLRSLMGGGGSAGGPDSPVFSSLTHIIIDEVHERDSFSDFLLTVIKKALLKFPQLKLVLMSATAEVDLFKKYFPGAVNLSVPGRVHHVKEVFLEDILAATNYVKPKVDTKKASENVSRGDIIAADIAAKDEEKVSVKSHQNVMANSSDDEEEDLVVEMDPESRSEIDDALEELFKTGSEESIAKLMSIYFGEDGATTYVPVNYQHSETGVTGLMVGAGRNLTDVVEAFLVNGADTRLKSLQTGWTAKDFAVNMNAQDTLEIICRYEDSLNGLSMARSETLKVSEETSALLAAYHQTFQDDEANCVDHRLTVALIQHLLRQSSEDNKGSILVFLPGYEDIVNIKQMLDDLKEGCLILMLHSQMPTEDQKLIFRPSHNGLRKVILSTNIAETSLTINDVTCVVDCGKVKEKTYDGLSDSSMLKLTWISKSSAEQRKGRAGRTGPGVCYKLYSSARAASLCQRTLPEILRIPLTDLCLATKLMAPSRQPIAEFLAEAPEPPSFVSTRAAVAALKSMEALDQWEDVTELGSCLLDLPIEPKLGKMVLYGVVLKCLDPILTIVCCISYKDPFTLTANSERRTRDSAKEILAALAQGSMSDHMTLLRAFQGWQAAKQEGREFAYCRKFGTSASTLEMVTGIRAQLLGQLRASGFVRPKGPHDDIKDLNRNSEKWAVVKAAIVAGSYPSMARYDEQAGVLRTKKESKVRLHPRSVVLETLGQQNVRGASKLSKQAQAATLRNLPPDCWLVFDEMTKAGRLSLIKGVTAVSPLTVALFAGPTRLSAEAVNCADASYAKANPYLEDTSDSDDAPDEEGTTGVEEANQSQKDQALLKIDDWVVFCSDRGTIDMVLKLRQKVSALFLRRLADVARLKASSEADDAVLDTIVDILTAEDMFHNFSQPAGVGQRPVTLGADKRSSARPHKYQNEKRGVSYTAIRAATRGGSAGSGKYEGQPQSLLSQPPTKQPQLQASTKYFVLKAISHQTIDVSMEKGLWQFGNQTEKKLNKALRLGCEVILLFSVQGSGHFQGYARFTGTVSRDLYAPELVAQSQNSGSGNQYIIEWVKRMDLPFHSTNHLVNAFNEDNRIQVSRDGQEVEPSAGAALCQLWDGFPSVGGANVSRGYPTGGWQYPDHDPYRMPYEGPSRGHRGGGSRSSGRGLRGGRGGRGGVGYIERGGSRMRYPGNKRGGGGGQ